MVVDCMPKTQDPRRFYGSGLPRPRFYSDVKLNSERIDPPVSVMDPLLSWARDAHWSMGGLSFERHRLQGRIEGSIKKLRAHQEERLRTPPASKTKKNVKVSDETPMASLDSFDSDSSSESGEEEKGTQRVAESLYRRKRVGVVDSSLQQRKRARKLSDVFDLIAAEQQQMGAIASRTRSSRKPAAVEEEAKKEVGPAAVCRTSPRKKSTV